MNSRIAFASLLACTLFLAACGRNQDGPAAGSGADLIISGGPILTMEGKQPAYVEAVVIDDGKIVFAGAAAEAMKQEVSDTVVKDLAGKALLPGFIDPHSHFMDSLTMADRVNVSAPPVGPASNPDEIVAELQKAAAVKGLKPGELLLGWGMTRISCPRAPSSPAIFSTRPSPTIPSA